MTLDLNEIQGRLIYSIIVAGKSAKFADRAIGELMKLLLQHNRVSPFEAIRVLVKVKKLGYFLRLAKVGNYTKIERALREMVAADLDLTKCRPQDLERIHGIGPKTSRFFILWTRPTERYAALDVHILRWMRSIGYDAPTSTPTGAKYLELEAAFIHEADERGVTPRELDFSIWADASGYAGPVQTGPRRELLA
jgi:thermostable 8-oxoguanine DNA glycosylase